MGRNVLTNSSAARSAACSAAASWEENGDDHPDKSAVAPVQPNGVHHSVDLPPVLTGHNSAVGLIPAEHQLAIEPLLNDQPVDFNTFPALAPVVANVEADPGWAASDISPADVLVNSDSKGRAGTSMIV